MFYEDLSHLEHGLVAVGWLDLSRTYTRGEVEEEFFDKLFELLRNPWQPAVAAGIHLCDLCRFSGGVSSVRYNDETIQVGASNLYVPGDNCIYYAPSMIAHYIDAHEYAPPQQFIEAVSCCPPMRSISYLKKLLDNGGRALIDSQR